MSSARASHILTGRMKKDLWYAVVLNFLGTNRVTFVLLLDLVALERTRLVEITVGLTLTSPVTVLKKKPYLDTHASRTQGVQFEQSVFMGILRRGKAS